MQASVRILRIRDDSEQRDRVNNCETGQASCVDVNILCFVFNARAFIFDPKLFSHFDSI